MYVYRWDLDKTYLDTDFDSIRGLVRSATESATEKRAVPGAAMLARALGNQPGARIHILSGSPTQMRTVLEEKLRLDGVPYELLTLKDNLENLKRGRIRAIRGQFGYKLPALLASRTKLGGAVRETLFGDDAEADALVYSVYADAVAGHLNARDVSRIMEAANAYPDQINEALDALAGVATADAVDRIFIRLDRGLPTRRFDVLGRRVVPIHSWWQAALVLVESGQLAPSDAHAVRAAVWRECGEDDWAVAGLTQDIVRRGHVDHATLERPQWSAELMGACRRAVARLRPGEADQVPRDVSPIDYLGLVRQW